MHFGEPGPCRAQRRAGKIASDHSPRDPTRIRVLATRKCRASASCPTYKHCDADREEVMIELSRRDLIAGAGAATVASVLSPPAEAAAPLGARQAPGYYRMKLGEFEITVVN